MKGMDLGLGVYNLFDSDYRITQPYAGGHAPFPTLGREAFVMQQGLGNWLRGRGRRFS